MNSLEPIHISSGGNVLASCLTILLEKGYMVAEIEGSSLLEATKGKECRLVAEDPLLLLGLATLFESRGHNWRPSDEEVECFLKLDSERDSA